ncbi:MAG: cysteine desulfurase [Chloroflexi bacterium]|nr:cysteine desulfurase [Chloroflexota bacterium]MBK7914687.1 cysteine desulfurase [Chloroflexota bacterium]MBP6803892.1 cysteine desulfurase [Chloroflexota bacterium]MBP7590101.1 cysteine desulfurase [Chloroflexota bacterium]
MLDVEKIRADFPILSVEAYPGVPLVYLDSAASSQKPEVVLAAMDAYYRQINANVHRGIHRLSEDATNAYEAARLKIARFINAPDESQIIYVRNATEGFNLVAYSWGRQNIQAGDEILLTEMEHHANLVPWQMLAEEKGAVVRYIPFLADGTLDLSRLDGLLTERTKLFSFTAVSNVFGTINPVRQLVDAGHAVGAVVMVDAAQAVPHTAVDVQAWDCDFMTFSGHKMCGPTGIGILYGKRRLLESMPPFMGGGDMIRRVTLEGSTWNDLPWKFEAGTPSIAEGIGLGTAVDYLAGIGMDNIHAHEQFITHYALEALSEIKGITLYGPPASQRAGVATFTIQGIHPHDISEVVDKDGIAIRAGHHCAMPLHLRLNVSATARASFYLHTTTQEIDKLVASLNRTRKLFRL